MVSAGMERDGAYRIVQQASTEALETGSQLRAVLAADSECNLSEEELDSAFDLDRYLAHAGDAVDHLGTLTADWMRSRSGV